jgi:predicted molibdopterin-dependent oxidoreductase YjgC
VTGRDTPKGLRITAGVTRGAHVQFLVDGIACEGFEGESVAAALMAAGRRTLRHGPVDGGPRGLFCAMGSCQECVVQADGVTVEACRLPVRAGLTVQTAR